MKTAFSSDTDLEMPIGILVPKETARHSLVKVAFWVLALILGFLHAWAYHHSMNPDGICYLDIADAYARGDWPNAINAYWSPLYSWLLGLGLLILRPSPYWEFPVAHFVNFIIYVGALICFEIFLRELIHCNREESVQLSRQRSVALPEWALSSLGYMLFIWSSLQLITIRVVAPDLLAAALVYLAAGLMLKIKSQPDRWLPFVLLGVVLGLGYLARSFMFQLAFIFFAASLISVGDIRKSLLRALPALAIFLFVAAPFILALSNSKGHFTVGEQARLKQLFIVNTFAMPSYEQLADPRYGQPKHPARKIFDRPIIYEFGTPVGGTYPFHYDESYWFEGMTPVFNLKQQLVILRSGIRLYGTILFRSLTAFTVGFLILFFVGCKHWPGIKGILRQKPFLVPTLFALAAFLPFYVEERVAAPFVVLLGMGLFSGIRLPDLQESIRLIKGVTIAILAVIAVQFSVLMDREVYLQARGLIQREDPSTHLQWQVAQTLQQMGIQPQDRVASIGPSYGHYWARLARVRIVAEIHSLEDVQYFWTSDADTQAQVIHAFGTTGARAIVTESPPYFSPPSGWQRIGTTPYYVYLLS